VNSTAHTASPELDSGRRAFGWVRSLRALAVGALGLSLGTIAFLVVAIVSPTARVVAAPAAQDDPQAPVCKKCASTGRLPCTEHKKECVDDEDSVLFCSVIADCPVCGGTGWIPCPECNNEPVRAALDKKKEEVAKRKITLKVLDDKMGRPLCKSETKHAILVWELERDKVDKKFLNQHEGMHLYAKRLESLYSDYLGRMQMNDKDFHEKFRVFVWWLPKDQVLGSTTFCDQGATGGVKLMGQRPAYSVCGNKQNFQDDEKLHRNIVHCVTHLLLSAQKSPAWIGNLKAGWLDEGLAHWFEDRYWNICDNYCYQEANTNVDFKSGRFKLAVRKLVEMEKAPPAAVVFERNVDTLTLPENAVAFSYVDYLMTNEDTTKFVALTEELKRKVPTRDALKKIYGYGTMEFEGMWKAWVLATYPTK
jgi:hypothetical protein